MDDLKYELTDEEIKDIAKKEFEKLTKDISKQEKKFIVVGRSVWGW